MAASSSPGLQLGLLSAVDVAGDGLPSGGRSGSGRRQPASRMAGEVTGPSAGPGEAEPGTGDAAPGSARHGRGGSLARHLQHPGRNGL